MGKAQRPTPPLRDEPAKQAAPAQRVTSESEPRVVLAAVVKRRRTIKSKESATVVKRSLSSQSAVSPRKCAKMDGASLQPGDGESVSASSTPSEDSIGVPCRGAASGGLRSGGSDSSMGRDVSSGHEFGGARGFFLRKPLSEDTGTSQFSSLLRDLKSDDSLRQITALTELSENLSYSSEETLISFPMETFIPALISLLESTVRSDEAAAQVMLLCCRCLFTVVDILPPTTRIITAAGGLPVLCASLRNVEYIDVAEIAVSIVQCIAEDQPLHVLRAGGLQAILTFLDFFQMSVQRQACNAAALMLLPVSSADSLEHHIKPVLPTLVTLLQHSDPHVVRSACECWRRLIDNTVSVHRRSRTSDCTETAEIAPISGFVSKVNAEAIGANATSQYPLSATLQEVCPNNVLGVLLALLGNAISSPSAHSAIVVAEVLYILSVLANYSDAFVEDILKQDVCDLISQPARLLQDNEIGHPSTQANCIMLRILALVASMLPAIRFKHFCCECEENRMALFMNNPTYLRSLVMNFAPLLVDIYEGSIDHRVQSLCVTLLLTFLLSCRDRPDLIQSCLNPAQLAHFMANLLSVSSSRSKTLACLLISRELLERHSNPYSLLLVRHGVVREIHDIATRGAVADRPEADGAEQTVSGESSGRMFSRAQMVEETAHRVLSAYFSSSSHCGESPILRDLGKVSKQLRSSPVSVIAAHREALNKLRELACAPESFTSFELTCSGVVGALSDFLYPPHLLARVPSDDQASVISEEQLAACGERLRLFLDCFGGHPKDDALVNLVKLCVAAIQRLENQPLMLFPTQSSLSAGLPAHLRAHSISQGKGNKLNKFAFGVEDGYSLGSRMAGRNNSAQAADVGVGHGTSTTISVLRLMAKSVRIRMGPNVGTQPPTNQSAPTENGMLPNFCASLDAAFLRKAGSQQEAPSGTPMVQSNTSGSGAASSAVFSTASFTSVTSPATRLRNFMAAKLTRKRSAPTSIPGSAPFPVPAEKRSGGVSSLLARTIAGSASAVPFGLSKNDAKQSRFSAPEMWSSAGSWDADEDDGLWNLSHHSRRGSNAAEIVEAVLLAEPFAMVSALEEYVLDRHGRGRSQDQRPQIATKTSAARASFSQHIGSGILQSNAASLPHDGNSTQAARVRLSMKQPPLEMHASVSGESPPVAADQPSTPLAIVDPGTPTSPLKLGFGLDSNPQEFSSACKNAESSAGSVCVREAAIQKEKCQQKVRVYLNGNLLQSRTSIVENIVKYASMTEKKPNPQASAATTTHSTPHCLRIERLLSDGDEADSGSEGENRHYNGTGNAGGALAGAIWGRVHCMTYEIVGQNDHADHSGEATSQAVASVPCNVGRPTEEPNINPGNVNYVGSGFDALVYRHVRDLDAIQTFNSFPQKVGTSSKRDSPGKSFCVDDSLQGSYVALLKLAITFRNVADFVREETDAETSYINIGSLEEDIFYSGSLTSALLQQLSDPLAVCTGSVPQWCADISRTCWFLFPASVRRIMHNSCNLGLIRALHHVQQRALAQHAHSPELQRRLEGEAAVASIPRQKVRISRQRLLDSAVKVMDLYASDTAMLEVEYVGEVGTGSGPTLEFYAQVADMLVNSEPTLFRQDTPGGKLFPAPREPGWLRNSQDQAARTIRERFRLLGQVVAKCIIDGRLVDMQLHPLFWRLVLGRSPLTRRSLREVDPALHNSIVQLHNLDDDGLKNLCVTFHLPGNPEIELKTGGAAISLTKATLEEYIDKIAEVTLVDSIACQAEIFRQSFSELLPLKACGIWSETELSSFIVGSSVLNDACWTFEHLAAHVKAQHGYSAESRCFQDLLAFMAELSSQDRRRFLTFVTGAPSLPVGGFASLKPLLTVVKKEAPSSPENADQYMPSVMTCANYLKIPDYSTADLLREKLLFAMCEGQSAFLLS